MNQPDLGLKITELRQQKGLTQEKLAEYCDVSTRTIQRIESGEVEPRSFTRNSLSNILDFDLGKENTNNQSFWLALMRMSSVSCIVFIPLLLWSWKKDQSYQIDRQGRDVLNFQITIMLVLVAFILVFIAAPSVFLISQGSDRDPGIVLGNIFAGLPPLLILLLGLFTTYQAVVNTVRALSDNPIRLVFHSSGKLTSTCSSLL
ncbi:MAG TPA: helix-turn-helix domain-containing protein [Anaerolineales bacterium]|nr:helix-turn-helix domain-containing protein [Anaerolineales bacterium]